MDSPVHPPKTGVVTLFFFFKPQVMGAWGFEGMRELEENLKSLGGIIWYPRGTHTSQGNCSKPRKGRIAKTAGDSFPAPPYNYGSLH
jgi:hypothetical protein